MQCIKCPKYETIMGGCSSKIHTGEKRCYYQCANCKTRVSEKKIEKQKINFLDDMLDFFLLVDNTYKPYLCQETENELKKCNKIINELNQKEIENIECMFRENRFNILINSDDKI